MAPNSEPQNSEPQNSEPQKTERQNSEPQKIDLGYVESARGRLHFTLHAAPGEPWAVVITGIDPGDLRKAGIGLRLREAECGTLKALMAKERKLNKFANRNPHPACGTPLPRERGRGRSAKSDFIQSTIAKINAAIAALHDTRQQNHQKLMTRLKVLPPETLQHWGIDPAWVQ